MRAFATYALVLSIACSADHAAAQVAVDSSQLIDDLVLANHILANEGVCDGYGHTSARLPNQPTRFLLSRALAPAIVSRSDLIVFDLEGQPIAAEARALFAERFIHAAVYAARPDVAAVVHCHPPSIIPFANSNVTLRPMTGESAFLLAGAPVFEGMDVPNASGILVTDMVMGRALAQVLSDKSVALMRGHGAVVVGTSIREAVARSVYLDMNAKMQSQAILLGGDIRYLAPADRAFSAAAQEAVRAAGATDRAWQHWVWRLNRR